MPKEVVIIGAGGHGRVVADIVKSSGDIVLGFLDDGNVSGVTLLGKVEDCVKYKDKYIFIAIGNNDVRCIIAEKYKGLNYYTAIHPTAVVGSDAEICKGTCLMPYSVVNSGAIIGEHCIINTHATVEHDCRVDDFVHVSPGAVLCGTVSVGKKSHIGAGATVRNNLTVCENVTVGAGGAVVKNIDMAGTYVGVPAKKIDNLE